MTFGTEKFGIGQPVTRVEDMALLTGRGCYTDDIDRADALSAHILRSPVAHARLVRVDAETARGMPGVHLVLTGEDIERDGIANVPCQYDAVPRKDTPRPALARGKVRHVGEPVALIVADTLEQARDAAEAVEVEFEELPAVVDQLAALEPEAPQLFDDIPGNLVFDWDNDQTDKAATDAAFAKAAHITRLELRNNRVVANSMEPRAALAEVDAATGRVSLHTSTQGPHLVLDPLADAVPGLGKDALRVVTGNVGGGFGMKAFIYPEHVLTVWAARKLGRAIRWTSDRSEAFMSDNQGRDHAVQAEIAMNEEGRFLGVRVEIVANMGAYLSPRGPFIPTRSTDLIAGLYTTPAIHVNVKGACTNTVPVCAYRGAGRPESAYLIERLVDAAARDIGLSPDEIRRRNFIPPDAMPYTTATGVTYDSGEFERVMDKAMEAADWAGFPSRRDQSAARGRLRGIGMATYTERCGGGIPETATIAFEGDRIRLVMGCIEYGTGLVTSFKQVVADRLKVDPDRMDVVMGDTDLCPPGLTGGSRALPVAGSALHIASEAILDKGRRIAAHLLEAAATDVEFADGAFRIVGTDRSIDLFDVAAAARDPARLPDGMEPGLDETCDHMPEGATYPNGCHIVELEIDPDTGTVSVDRYTVVDDFGRVINPVTLLGQVHGGIAQGLGQALWEETVYDPDTGQIVTGSFMDYGMPRADLMPPIDFSTHNVPCRNNPLGVKGAGEAGAIGAPPAAMNAVVDALHHAKGLRTLDMPATPRRVWEALNAA